MSFIRYYDPFFYDYVRTVSARAGRDAIFTKDEWEKVEKESKFIRNIERQKAVLDSKWGAQG